MKMKARADPSSEFVLALSQWLPWRLPGGSKGSQRPPESWWVHSRFRGTPWGGFWGAMAAKECSEDFGEPLKSPSEGAS